MGRKPEGTCREISDPPFRPVVGPNVLFRFALRIFRLRHHLSVSHIKGLS